MSVPKIMPVLDPTGASAKPHHPYLPAVDVDVQGGGSLLLMISPVK